MDSQKESDANIDKMDHEDLTSDSEKQPSTSKFGDKIYRSTLDSDGLKYPQRDGTLLSQLYNQPIVTTLTGFSQVANFVRNPYEWINNVEEVVKQSGGSSRKKYQRTSENFARTLNQNRCPSTPTSPMLQEMDTFVAASHDQSTSSAMSAAADSGRRYESNPPSHENQIPIPAIPSIECTLKRGRLQPLTIDEYENNLREKATDLELIERVFFGSMSCNQIRAALWPYLFGIVKHRGKFEKITNQDGQGAYLFVEHATNQVRWTELQKLYHKYQSQWKSILPDQELRFSTFRERKLLIERDVIRCDRLHPFYADEPNNLATLTNLLMTYMMYDFDIGYVQGMSDLAGPILYLYQGDLVKSFWVFVEVMKLFRRNFELTQKTIHFQLNCLYELIKNTDPIFAQYLKENDSSNCFFVFRAIVCQFKRELMKENEDDYSKVLFLWDTIWSARRRHKLQEDFKALQVGKDQAASTQSDSTDAVVMQPMSFNDQFPFFSPFDPNQSDTPRHTLTETEIFVLALCLSMIRRERDLVLANKLDGTDIHLHFIDPKLASDLNGFIEHGINIYSYIKTDFDIKKLTMPKMVQKEAAPESPQGSAEGYDLLNDFLVISANS